MELTEHVVIKAADVADAVSKMRKLIKRGAVDQKIFSFYDLERWYRGGLPLYIAVNQLGQAYYHNHDCQPAAVLKRVRDVENYRVQ